MDEWKERLADVKLPPIKPKNPTSFQLLHQDIGKSLGENIIDRMQR